MKNIWELAIITARADEINEIGIVNFSKVKSAQESPLPESLGIYKPAWQTSIFPRNPNGSDRTNHEFAFIIVKGTIKSLLQGTEIICYGGNEFETLFYNGSLAAPALNSTLNQLNSFSSIDYDTLTGQYPEDIQLSRAKFNFEGSSPIYVYIIDGNWDNNSSFPVEPPLDIGNYKVTDIFFNEQNKSSGQPFYVTRNNVFFVQED